MATRGMPLDGLGAMVTLATAIARHRASSEDGPAPTRPQAVVPAHYPALTGRNEPCPCGSGKKYKRCCKGGPLRQPYEDVK